MGITERKEREKETRRENIIDAAEKVIQLKGFEGMTIDDVAVIAELGKGTIYLYFKNKTDLYHAVVCRGLKILKATFNEVVKREEKGIDKLLAIGHAYAKFCFDFPIYFNAMSHRDNMEVEREKIAEHEGVQCCEIVSDQIFAMMTGVIEEGGRDRTIQADIEPMKLSILLWGLVSGVLKMLSSKGEMIDKYWNIKVEELIDLQFELVRRAIEPRQEGAGAS
jgi:AcrR family transcriptional regulator